MRASALELNELELQRGQSGISFLFMVLFWLSFCVGLGLPLTLFLSQNQTIDFHLGRGGHLARAMSLQRDSPHEHSSSGVRTLVCRLSFSILINSLFSLKFTRESGHLEGETSPFIASRPSRWLCAALWFPIANTKSTSLA